MNEETILGKSKKITVATHHQHGTILILEKIKLSSNYGDYFLVLDVEGQTHTVNPGNLTLFTQEKCNIAFEEIFRKYFSVV